MLTSSLCAWRGKPKNLSGFHGACQGQQCIGHRLRLDQVAGLRRVDRASDNGKDNTACHFGLRTGALQREAAAGILSHE